ncbi:hypothetical protein [Dactylosporangium sp. CA-233914]|uniref:hypothetical protein n=1 Tax=Dactylosporangium sp. CA-233914 TaxID=3239934 RepID=UPI003D8C808C
MSKVIDRNAAVLDEGGALGAPTDVLVDGERVMAIGHGLVGREAEDGRIAPGHIFDAVVLGKDPSDLRVFAEPGSVADVSRAGRRVGPGGSPEGS